MELNVPPAANDFSNETEASQQQFEPITQDELASIIRLRQERAQVDKELGRIRASVLARAVGEADIEDGRYGVSVRKMIKRKFSRKSLEQAFGSHYVAQLAAHLPESETTQLYVKELTVDLQDLE